MIINNNDKQDVSLNATLKNDLLYNFTTLLNERIPGVILIILFLFLSVADININKIL